MAEFETVAKASEMAPGGMKLVEVGGEEVVIANHVRQPECVIESTVGKQSSVGSDFGTVKLKLEPTVKTHLRTPSFDSPIG